MSQNREFTSLSEPGQLAVLFIVDVPCLVESGTVGLDQTDVGSIPPNTVFLEVFGKRSDGYGFAPRLVEQIFQNESPSLVREDVVEGVRVESFGAALESECSQQTHHLNRESAEWHRRVGMTGGASLRFESVRYGTLRFVRKGCIESRREVDRERRGRRVEKVALGCCRHNKP